MVSVTLHNALDVDEHDISLDVNESLIPLPPSPTPSLSSSASSIPETSPITPSSISDSIYGSTSPSTAPSSEAHGPSSCTPRKSSISFAPLPVLEPRERRYRLGISTRARALRIQQGLQPLDNEVVQEHEAMMNDSEQRLRRRRRVRLAEEEDYIEDPFVVLGRFVKGAGQRLSRRLGGGKRSGGQSDRGPGGMRIGVLEVLDLTEENEEGGKVWEEEIGEEFRARQLMKTVPPLVPGKEVTLPRRASLNNMIGIGRAKS